MSYREEHDSMGTVKVPTRAYYGSHTQRSIHNFPISGKTWHAELISAIAEIKKACAQANHQLKLLKADKKNAIVKACNAVIRGDLSDQFPLDVFQAGSGTSTHMNVNEVIANYAATFLGGKKGDKSLIHPHDDVNKGQSTNNVIPTAIRIASLRLVDQLAGETKNLAKQFRAKGKQFNTILKSGRTHLQDAVPLRLGQEFAAYATALEKHIARLQDTKQFLREVGIGGNAVGTGLNTKKAFRKTIVSYLKKNTKLNLVISKDGIESTQFLTDIAAVSSAVSLLAVDLNKIANDLRLLSSGPKTGFNEINLPAVEPGSSIMPGKINPSIAEATNMACHYVMGLDTTVKMSCTSGNLELNTHMPLIGHSVVESLSIMANAISVFTKKSVAGITANKEQCHWYVEHSMALATALNPYLGYDTVAGLVKESLRSNTPLKQLVVEKKLLSKKELDKILAPATLTKPNL